MEEYSVIITPDAEKDLNELDDYISIELQAPEIALAYIATIKQELSTLQTTPKRYRLMDEEPWHSRGVRRMNVKNFAVFYQLEGTAGSAPVRMMTDERNNGGT